MKYKIHSLKKGIDKLGCKLIKCNNNCKGIRNNGKNILPRGLILETQKKDNKDKGCIIVGINPGNAKDWEKKFYRVKGASYKSSKEIWGIGYNDKEKHKALSKLSYYSKLRYFAHQEGFNGPILWTDLVKCENEIKKKTPSQQTFRTCVMNYLNSEEKLIPKDWPIIAAGRETYKALAYLYPKRIVIGIPHASSSWGHFSKLFTKNKQLRKIFKIPNGKLVIREKAQAMWFDSTKKRVL